MEKLTKEQTAVFCLLRRALWGEALPIPENVDWEAAGKFAKEQDVVSFLYDGAAAANAPVPGALLQKWRSGMLQGVVRNERLLRAQDELLGWLRAENIPVVVLKGSSVSRYYPQPDLRILGDIDILVAQPDVDRVKRILEQHGYRFCEHDHNFHLSFSRPDAYVELHYNVTKLPDSDGGRAAGEVIDTFLQDIEEGTLHDYVFPVLSQPNQALMLLLHMIRHMFSSGIGLRQLCDWAVYMAEADLARFEGETLPVLERCGLRNYAAAATAACIRYLGLSEKGMDWCSTVEEETGELFLSDILRSGNMGQSNREGMGGLLVDSERFGKKTNPVQALLKQLTQLAYKNFPVAEKCRLLLPVFWAYLPLRYYVRSLTGKRPKKSLMKIMKASVSQRDLLETVKAFVVEER
ncbi:MAG: nucleotidyltransferase family protein [Oscillospiraceae bacterium]|nr:nucleotidyltransferase family protein [Oscillospiraceae bacterium]